MSHARLRNLAAFYSATALAVAGMASSGFAAELLANNGFELPTATGSEDTVASGWTFSGTIERVNFVNHTTPGSRSIWCRTFDDTDSFVSQTVDVVPSTSYTLSAYEYFEANYASLTNANIDLKVTWLDSTNAAVGSLLTEVTTASNPATAVWNLHSITGNAPANAAHAMVTFGWTNGGGSGPQLSAFGDDISLTGQIVSSGSVWNVNGSGDWNDQTNWANVVVPNAVGAEADFFGKITAPQTVYSNTAITAGTVSFNNTNTYVIAGAGTLTLQAATGNAVVSVLSGTQKINLPLTIASNTVFNVSGGATLLISDPVTVTAGKTLTPSGTGAVNYQSIVTVQSGAGMAFGNATHAAGLVLQGTSTGSILMHSGSTQSLLQVDSLSIATGASLDLTNNALLTNTTPNAMRLLLQSGQVKTSLTANGTAVGYADVGNGQVKARYTYSGDSNIDGQVDIADLGALASHWQQSNSVWTSGDFNYDGVVNIADLGLLATNWQKGVGNPLAISFADALAGYGLSGAAVPEPTSLGLLAVAGLSLARRRRAC